jgi:hypothetical protein
MHVGSGCIVSNLCSVRILAGTPIIPSGVLRDFPHLRQKPLGWYLKAQYHYLPPPTNHPTLYSLSTRKRRYMKYKKYKKFW